MRATTLVLLSGVVLTCACARMQTSTDAEAYAERMTRAGERYTACVAAEAEKDVANPAGVEDIAVAAHGRCWAHWDAYREATNSTYLASATTREEMQLAHDRADAHLRQFERDTRRSVMDGLVERTFARTKPP